MVAEPAATPVTTPVVAFTVAVAGLLLLQLPPPVPLLVKMAVEPLHKLAVPVTVPASGRLPTVTTIDWDATPHTDATVYEIVEVPGACAFTRPVFAFTVAVEVLLLLHIPPVILLDKSVVEPVHK